MAFFQDQQAISTKMVISDLTLEPEVKPEKVLEREFQSRIGIIPKIYPLDESISEQSVQTVFYTEPKSFSEICRIVRASKTLRLCVRACGSKSSEDLLNPGPQPSVLINCRGLKDQPPISRVYIRRKGCVGEEPGLRITAGVRMNELINFMVHNCIQIDQSFDLLEPFATVISGIINAKAGIARQSDPYTGSCIGDEVLSIRIVDSEGDLVEYSSEEELKFAVTNYGILGIVYDVTLRYKPMAICRNEHEYVKMSDLMISSKLATMIDTTFSMELIYIPFNQWDQDQDDWDPTADLVLLKSSVQLLTKEDEPKDPLTSEPRFRIPIIDPVFGPDEDCYVDAMQDLNNIKLLMQSCFENQRRQVLEKKKIRLFTPWTLNSHMEIPHKVKHFTVSVVMSEKLQNFGDLLRKICSVLKKYAVKDKPFPLNVALKVNFTRENLQEMNDPLENKTTKAHFKFIALEKTINQSAKIWSAFTKDLLENLESLATQAVISWDSSSPSKEIFVENYKKAFEQGCRAKVKKQSLKKDIDGMFLNEVLENILIKDKMTAFQLIYRKRKNLAF